MTRTRLLWLVVAGVSVAGWQPAWGDDPVLAELYGRGVHAYFARDFQQAHQFLTMAIDKGTQDPRVYYFRGLTYAMTGRPQEAEADFRKGAELEAADVDNYYNVSRALQRVQGSIRLTLEKHRQQARLEARERNERIARAKYQEFLENQKRVLLPPQGAIGQPVIPPGVEQKAPSANDPFTTPPAESSAVPPAPAQTAPPPAAPRTSPASPPAQAAPPPPSNDPSAPPAAKSDDPFAPAKTPSPSAPGTGQAGSRKGGALSGLLRAVRKVASPPSLPGGVIPGGGGGTGGGGDPFGPGPKGDKGTDPFAPQGNAPQGGNKPTNEDPFAPRK